MALVMSVVHALTVGLPGQDVSEEVKLFGTRTSPAINAGFCICDLKALPRPFVVERRELQITINGALFSRGPEWPPFQLAVTVDPGDPVPGSSPLDPVPAGQDRRSTYWALKARYLASHLEPAEAGRQMAEALRKSGAFTLVEQDPGAPLRFHVTEPGGRRTRISLKNPGEPQGATLDDPRPLAEIRMEVLKQREEEMDDLVAWLTSGGLLGWVSGGGWDYALSPEAALRFDQAVGNQRDPQMIVFSLRQAQLFRHDDEEMSAELRTLFSNGSYFAAYRSIKSAVEPVTPAPVPSVATHPRPQDKILVTAPKPVADSQRPAAESSAIPLISLLCVTAALAVLIPWMIRRSRH